MDKKNKRNIYFLLFAGVVILSTSGILIRLATAAPLIIAFYRMFFSILFMSPFIFQKYREALVYFKEIKLLLVGFFLAAHFFLWTTAFEYTSVSNAVIFIALQPLFTYLLEYFFAREDLQPGIMSGIIFAVLGSIVISIGNFNGFLSVSGEMYWPLLLLFLLLPTSLPAGACGKGWLIFPISI